jgi:hypothetical protein
VAGSQPLAVRSAAPTERGQTLSLSQVSRRRSYRPLRPSRLRSPTASVELPLRLRRQQARDTGPLLREICRNRCPRDTDAWRVGIVQVVTGEAKIRQRGCEKRRKNGPSNRLWAPSFSPHQDAYRKVWRA